MLKWLIRMGQGPQGGGGHRHLQPPPTLTPHHYRLHPPHHLLHRRRLTPIAFGLLGEVGGCGGAGGGLGVSGGGFQRLDGSGRVLLHPTPSPPRQWRWAEATSAQPRSHRTIFCFYFDKI